MNKGVARAVRDRKLAEIAAALAEARSRLSTSRRSTLGDIVLSRGAGATSLRDQLTQRELELSAPEPAPCADERGDQSEFRATIDGLMAAQRQQLTENSFLSGLDSSLRARVLMGAKDPLRAPPLNADAIHALALRQLPSARLLDPHGPRKTLWDNAILLVVLFSLLWIPFSFSFDTEFDAEFEALELAICALFLVDVLVTLNTAELHKEKGRYLLTRREVAVYYAKRWLLVDLLSSVPIDILISLTNGAQTKELGLIRLLRFVRVSKVVKFLKRRVLTRYETAGLAVLAIVFLCHTFGCFWWFLGRNGGGISVDGIPSSWIELAESKGIRGDGATTLDDYVMSVYFAVVTLLTVGYGDITPVTDGERVFAMVLMVVGAVSFGYLVSQVSRIMDSSDPDQLALGLRIAEFNAYLGERGVLPAGLRKRALSAYTYALNTHKSARLLQDPFFLQLPPSALNPIARQLFASVLEGSALLRGLGDAGHEDLACKAVLRSRPWRVDSGELLFARDEPMRDLTLLVKGRVLMQGAGRAGVCCEGGAVGDLELLLSGARACRSVCSYSALTECEFLSIPFADLLDLEPAHASGLRWLRTHSLGRAKALLEEGDGVWVDGQLLSASEAAPLLAVEAHAGLRFRCCTDARLLRFEEDTPEGIALNRWVLHPSLPLLQLWLCLLELFVLYAALAVAVQVAFHRAPRGEWRHMDRAVSCVFGIDILVRLRTAYFDPSLHAYVLDTAAIRDRYMRTWLAVDLVSALPWTDLVELHALSPSGAAVVNVLRLFKVLRLLNLFVMYDLVRSSVEQRWLFLVDLGTLAFKMLTLAHLVACAWWGVSAYATQGPSWIDESGMTFREDLRSSALAHQYIASLYWALTSLTTVGYGDIFSLNTDNRVLAMLVLLVGASLFGYVLGYVGVIFATLSSSKMARRAHVDHSKDLLESYEVAAPDRDRYLALLELKMSQESVYDEEAFLRELPPSVAQELYLLARREAIADIPLFEFVRDASDRYHLFRLLEVEYVPADEQVLSAGDASDCIRFVVRGSCAVCRASSHRSRRDVLHALAQASTEELEKRSVAGRGSDRTLGSSSSVVAKIFRGNFFGYCSLLSHGIRKYPYSVRTTESSCFYKLTRKALAALTSKWPELALKVQSALVRAIENQRQTLAKLKARYERFEFLMDVSSISASAHGVAKKAEFSARPWTDCFRFSRGEEVTSARVGHFDYDSDDEREAAIPSRSCRAFSLSRPVDSSGVRQRRARSF